MCSDHSLPLVLGDSHIDRLHLCLNVLHLPRVLETLAKLLRHPNIMLEIQCIRSQASHEESQTHSMLRFRSRPRCLQIVEADLFCATFLLV